ncbi:MAG: hypothetical protein AAGE96_01730 [Cyanobacteria bacterium P01_G01_bin.19]
MTTQNSSGNFDLRGAIFFGDQTLDTLYIANDLDGNGDANDPSEVKVYFDETNASGLTDPTGNIFTILSIEDGTVFYGDGNTDSVYRLIDLNKDGDALDAGEANVWFDATNAEGFPLLTPNGLSQGSDGAIYVVEADTRGTPNGDFVYRTEDLNGDGDANDSGESSVWLDLKALNPASSPFEITFIGDTAYIADTAGGSPVIYRAEDTDGSGDIDATEVEALVEGVFTFSVSSNHESLFALDLFNDSVLKIEDGDSPTTTEVWNSDAVPEGFSFDVGFSVAAGKNNELAVTSNGFDDNGDNIFRLVDLNGDGDYFDDGETIPYVSRLVNGSFPERPRVVEFAKTINEIIGTDGNDTLQGTAKKDIIHGGAGADRIDGLDGDDIISGGDDLDRIDGSIGNDSIFGGDSSDRINGGVGDDLLSGDAGNDFVRGGAGDDLLMGVTGNDTLIGQAGSDTFVFGNDDGTDRINDFDPSEDKIGLVEGELTFADISLTQQGNNVILGVSETGEELALLVKVSADAITEDSFVSIPDISDINDVL